MGFLWLLGGRSEPCRVQSRQLALAQIQGGKGACELQFWEQLAEAVTEHPPTKVNGEIPLSYIIGFYCIIILHDYSNKLLSDAPIAQVNAVDESPLLRQFWNRPIRLDSPYGDVLNRACFLTAFNSPLI